MAIASAKAIPSNIGTNSLSADSGLRPMDSMALPEPILPTAKAGNIPPMAIVKSFDQSGDHFWCHNIPFSTRRFNFWFIASVSQGLIPGLIEVFHVDKPRSQKLMTKAFFRMDWSCSHSQVDQSQHSKNCCLNQSY
jgi:hypothetical protein